MIILNPVQNAILKKWPEGNIYQYFYDNPQNYAQFGLAGHGGLDIALAEGTPLTAAFPGIVLAVKNDPGGYGKHIKVMSDLENGKGVIGVWGHCKDILVAEGQRVAAGQTIATMGNTGFVVSNAHAYWGNAPTGKGVHCHFGIQEYSKNPTTMWFYFQDVQYFIQKPDNGFKGYRDPTDYINELAEKKINILQQIRDLLLSFFSKRG